MNCETYRKNSNCLASNFCSCSWWIFSRGIVIIRLRRCSAYLFRGDSLHEPLATVPEEVDRVHVYDPYCPVHGSRRHLTQRRPIRDLGSFQVTTIDSVEINEPTSEILFRSFENFILSESMIMPEQNKNSSTPPYIWWSWPNKIWFGRELTEHLSL